MEKDNLPEVETHVLAQGAFGVSRSVPASELEEWTKQQKELEASMTKEEWAQKVTERGKKLVDLLRGKEKTQAQVNSSTETKT